MIERGCDTSKTGEDSLGCSVDGTAHSNFRSVTCYCDTARCNGLSVEALVCEHFASLRFLFPVCFYLYSGWFSVAYFPLCSQLSLRRLRIVGLHHTATTTKCLLLLVTTTFSFCFMIYHGSLSAVTAGEAGCGKGLSVKNIPLRIPEAGFLQA